jgi:hypothetical protein
LFSPISKISNDFISPTNYTSIKKIPNFIIAPGSRKGKNWIIDKLSPRTKAGRGNIAYLKAEDTPESPYGKKSGVLISPAYATQTSLKNQVEHRVSNRMGKDFSLTIDSQDSTRTQLKLSHRSPAELRKAKSSKRIGRGNKTTVEIKFSNIYTSNGFALGSHSPKNKDITSSSMVKIEKT